MIVNTAGDAFESFNERETGELVITIVVNEETYNSIEFDDYKHTTNTSVVTIDGIEYAADICKLSPAVGAKTTETVEQNNAIEDFTYYRNTYVVKARKKGWKDEIADIGLNELVPDADETKPPKLMPIVDATGLLIKKPWPLDGHGRKKPKPTDTPETLKFQPYTSIDWSDLKPFKPETWEQE